MMNAMDNDKTSDWGGDDWSEAESTTSHGTGEGGRDLEASGNEQTHISKAETQGLRRLKVAVFSVLLLTMVGVACAVYFLSRGAEVDEFHDTFHGSAIKVLNSVGNSIDLTLGAVDSLVVGMVSHAHSSNQIWPFVTIPDFALRTAKARTLSSAVFLNIYPFVAADERQAWENFTRTNNEWVEEGIEMMKTDHNYFGPTEGEYELWDVIHGDDEYDKDTPPGATGTNASEFYLPMWEQYPVAPFSFPPYNWDLSANPADASAIDSILNNFEVVISKAYLLPDVTDPDSVANEEYEAEWLSDFIRPGEAAMEPVSDVYYPIFNNLESVGSTSATRNNETFVGIMGLSLYWRDMIRDILPEDDSTVVVAVFENPCNPTFTYLLHGRGVDYLGSGDYHDPKYDDLEVSASVADFQRFSSEERKYSGVPLDQEHCPFTLRVFPTQTMEDEFVSKGPAIFTAVALLIFGVTAVSFLLYDFFVERRQKVVMKTAVQSSALVDSLFPSVVRDRVFLNQGSDPDADNKIGANKRKPFLSPSADSEINGQKSSPIAELYTDTSVSFMDIAGFTSWSSMRTPEKVFILLETLYGSFDAIARKRGVFKVETIGDSYVAATGLPAPRRNHASVMIRFAANCQRSMQDLTSKLSSTLGPDTADLRLRIGIHSGSVTAGVLRGDRSRFQLFGDTVNTAARMESNGIVDRIQVSKQTADLLIRDGKRHWLKAREDLIEAKGKGTMQTFWAQPGPGGSVGSMDTATSSEASYPEKESPSQPDKIQRLIDWNSEVLGRSLEQVVAHRSGSGGRLDTSRFGGKRRGAKGSTVSDEVVDVIQFRDLHHCRNSSKSTCSVPSMSPEATRQLKTFIATIAHLYHRNPFHNFEHASHVIMSVGKVLSRISPPDAAPSSASSVGQEETYSDWQNFSDPLVRFALLFSALIHDVDHPGVSNVQLMKQNQTLAVFYGENSIAEQNSIDIAWEVLMDPSFADLQACIFSTKEELKLFRQLVVNAVMSTDIMDTALKAGREGRWSKAFEIPETSLVGTNPRELANRRATIVIELIMQCSDVVHTMQHWKIYQKWNRALYAENAIAESASTDGKPSNLAIKWYNGELWFFDNYVLPLARKLKSCGVFGVSCDEFLEYGLAKRLEWESKGAAIVKEMDQAAQDDAAELIS